LPAADDRQLLEETARAAGRLALSATNDGVESWDKEPGHPVTQIDLAVDRFLRETLLAARPDYGWLSEETTDDPARLSASRLFIVDPIDGTRDLIRGRDGWAVAVAVVEDGRPVHGVIFAPALGRLYAASEGRGAWLNGRSIAASRSARLDDARLCIDRDVPRSKHWAGPRGLGTVYRPNSIALRVARVAAGEADLTFDGRPSHEWDTAAALLILSEAGGVITNETGEAFRYNKADPIERNLCASANPVLHEQALAIFTATLDNWRAARARKQPKARR
jgi:myo-inositol-1(or 4)-monophosphatase